MRLGRFRGTGLFGEAMPLTEDAVNRWVAAYLPDDVDAREDFLTVIRALDDHWLSLAAAEAAATRRPKP